MSYLFPILFCATFAQTVNGQVLEIQEGTEIVQSLEDYLEISDQPPNDPGILSQGGWLRWQQPEKDSLSEGISWFRLGLNNKGRQNLHCILYLHDIHSVEIVLVTDSMSISDWNHTDTLKSKLKAGTLIPFSERQTIRGRVLEGLGNSAQVELDLVPGTTTLFLKTKLFFPAHLNPQFELHTVNHWKRRVLKERDSFLFLQGVLLGALFIMSVYHFLIFLQKRDIPFLWYALYTFFTALSLMLEMGVAQVYLLPERLSLLLVIRETLLFPMTVAILYFLFMRSFIDLRQLLPRLDQMLTWYFWFIIPTGYFLIIWYMIAPNPDLLKIGHMGPITVLIMGAIYIVAVARTRNVLALYFVVGSLFLILGVLANTIVFHLTSTGFIEGINFPRNFLTEIGALLEILIFSLGLGYRLRLLEKQKQDIEELDQAKSRFFANISHEFRTPLTVIMGVAGQLRGHKKEQKLIQRNSQNLLQLVNQLLDLAKLESGALKLDNLQADVVAYLQYLTESVHSMADEKGVKLLFYSEEKALVMDFDEQKIKHIIYNLLSNAIKFTEAGGKVILHARAITRKGQSYLQIKVSDTGAGIPPTELPHIFDRFYQVDSPSPQEKTGTGVGLALTKELVALMGGEIAVKSELGEGSEFQLLLPVRQQAPMGQPHLQDIVSADPPSSGESSHFSAILPHLKPHAAKLLLIEDSSDVVTYIESLLKKEYQLTVAQDGQAGIDLAVETLPDIIISDVMMPKKNGYEVCRALKTDERTSHIPILLLTAKAAHEDKVEGLKEGADAYLTKPFDPEELLVRIENLVETRRKLQERYSNKLVTTLTQSKKTGSLDEIFLQKLVKVVEDRLDDTDLGVVDLCRAANLSNMQVNRKLKALTGETPSRFIRAIRLEKAMELLRSTDLNVSEVAYEVGFKDPNYFSRSFSEKFGHSPNVMRK